MEIEKALSKFKYLATGAPISNITFGESPKFFQELCMYAVSVIIEKQEHDKNRLEFKQALNEALDSEVSITPEDEKESCGQYCSICSHKICKEGM